MKWNKINAYVRTFTIQPSFIELTNNFLPIYSKYNYTVLALWKFNHILNHLLFHSTNARDKVMNFLKQETDISPYFVTTRVFSFPKLDGPITPTVTDDDSMLIQPLGCYFNSDSRTRLNFTDYDSCFVTPTKYHFHNMIFYSNIFIIKVCPRRKWTKK